MHSDTEIIEKLKGSSLEEGLQWIYANHFDAVLAQVQAQGGSEADGADIFQEAVIVLLQKVKTGQFRGESRLSTFLHGIARNMWLSELRSRKRRLHREKKFADGHLTIESNDSCEDSFQLKHEAIARLIGTLGDTCRRILRGFYFEKKKIRELLTEFAYENEQVLRNQKSKCMKKMREQLEKDKGLQEQIKTTIAYE